MITIRIKFKKKKIHLGCQSTRVLIHYIGRKFLKDNDNLKVIFSGIDIIYTISLYNFFLSSFLLSNSIYKRLKVVAFIVMTAKFPAFPAILYLFLYVHFSLLFSPNFAQLAFFFCLHLSLDFSILPHIPLVSTVVIYY